MDVFGCSGVELRAARQSAAKRRRFGEEPDECVPAKRPLTEDTMAAFMHQLHLTTSLSSPSSSSDLPHPPRTMEGPLNITAVSTTCPSSSSSLITCNSNDLLTRGATPSLRHDESPPPHHQSRVLTPPASSEVPSTHRPQQQALGSPLADGLDLASRPSRHSVHIRVTPATPPSSDSSSGSLSQVEDDCEPMEQSSLLPRHRTGHWGVVLEDLSSSDSSDSEMPPRLWIAPELKSLTSSTSRLLPPRPVLDEIAKAELAVVPWVSREQCFARVLAKSREAERGGDDGPSSEEEEEEGREREIPMYYD